MAALTVSASVASPRSNSLLFNPLGLYTWLFDLNRSWGYAEAKQRGFSQSAEAPQFLRMARFSQA
jgi:hypothetical protein